MYKAIVYYLQQGELSRAELSYLIGCNTAKSLQYYLHQLDCHGFIKRTGRHYQLASTKSLMVPCNRCKKECLRWTLDHKGRGTCCRPKQTLHIVDKAAPNTEHHNRVTRLLQQPFNAITIANTFNKEAQQ
ncbi:hypothetical protein [Thaumasiovibrio subtropicus]|uniref:hypothetical protein n=1 Tax=Thaumasiovibrio subtropicus TaxID=1891207 RepID=UPI000B34F4EA|nr:hypothetical protein [Thaumasiovibrio subtropicus]